MFVQSFMQGFTCFLQACCRAAGFWGWLRIVQPSAWMVYTGSPNLGPWMQFGGELRILSWALFVEFWNPDR